MNATRKKSIEVAADAETRIQLAREWIATYPRDTEILLLAHSLEAANDLYLSIVGSAESWFGIKRLTLDALAVRLAQLSLTASATASTSRFSFIAIVARAIHLLHARHRLDYFEPVAAKPGFPVAVARTLAELRMNEVDLSALSRLARGGKDLAAIASEVEHQLKVANLADRAVIFRAALESMKANSSFAGRPVLMLDVAPESCLEIELIRGLADHAPAVLATAPQGDDRAIAALEDALSYQRQQHSMTQATSSLAVARQHLFQDSAPARSELDESVQLQSWPGEPRECVEIVRSIQREAARHVPFDQMAVLLNAPGEYRSHLEEAFTRAEIPAYFSQGLTAPDPAGRAMLALLGCAANGLS